jgi:hypothetical protein
MHFYLCQVWATIKLLPFCYLFGVLVESNSESRSINSSPKTYGHNDDEKDAAGNYDIVCFMYSAADSGTLFINFKMPPESPLWKF